MAFVKFVSLISIVSFSIFSNAARPVFEADDVTEGRVCKECEARRILNDEWPNASPERRAEIAEQLTALNGKKLPPLNSTTTGQ